MAIKGKKKHQGHVRRRPAAAPRAPAIVRRPPWYRTDRGRIAIGIAVVAVVGVAWWVIADARAEAVALQRRQAALEDYTNGARALLQTVRPAAEGMARAPTDPNAITRPEN